MTPSTGSAEEDWITTFEVSGGAAPYTWSTTGGTLRTTSDSSRVVIAATATGSFTVSVRDSEGKSGTARLLVGSRQLKAEVRGLSSNPFDPSRGRILGSGNVVLVASEPRTLITAVVASTDPGPSQVRVSAYEASALDTPLQGYQDMEFSGTGIVRFVAAGPARGFFLANLSRDSAFHGSAQFFFTPEGRYDPPPPTLTLISTSLSGITRGANGSQLGGAVVEVVGADAVADVGKRVTSAGDGTFRLSGLLSVGVTLRASHPDYQSIERQFQFQVGSEISGIVFQLTRR